MDVGVVLSTYVGADVLRCRVWMRTPWPEVVEEYGSTIGLHLAMMAVIAVAWPLILRWLGWYRPIGVGWRRTVGQALGATALLALTIAGSAVLIHRELYPRAQIGLVAAILPLASLGVARLCRGPARRTEG